MDYVVHIACLYIFVVAVIAGYFSRLREFNNAWGALASFYFSAVSIGAGIGVGFLSTALFFGEDTVRIHSISHLVVVALIAVTPGFIGVLLSYLYEPLPPTANANAMVSSR